MSLAILSPAEAKRLMDEGAVLIDIREPHEYTRVRVPGALNRPLSQLDDGTMSDTAAVIFLCHSGMRTTVHAARLARAACGKAYVIGGGIVAWQRAGLPVSIG